MRSTRSGPQVYAQKEVWREERETLSAAHRGALRHWTPNQLHHFEDVGEAEAEVKEEACRSHQPLRRPRRGPPARSLPIQRH